MTSQGAMRLLYKYPPQRLGYPIGTLHILQQMGGQSLGLPCLVVGYVQVREGKCQERLMRQILSDQQKGNRVGFIISHLYRRGGIGVVVDDLYDWVYVDKK
ncbi:unnamed protein product [Choristocarpus tenellus]